MTGVTSRPMMSSKAVPKMRTHLMSARGGAAASGRWSELLHFPGPLPPCVASGLWRKTFGRRSGDRTPRVVERTAPPPKGHGRHRG